MTQLRRSIAWSAAQSYLGTALQLVSTVVLSRVLSPTEVGTFAVAAVFSALASNFRDFGIAEYLIQEKNLGERQIRAAFAVNIGVSWLMALLLFAGSGIAGGFYREDAVGSVMRIQALSFLLIPFGAINMAWFRREMNFKPMFVAGVLADVAGLLVAITLALQGVGASSLAWSSVAGVAATVAVSLWYRPPGFPRWPALQGLREVLSFGGFASGIYVLGQLGKGMPEMVIGRVQDVTAVGIYSRGSGLVQLFRQLVVRGIMPVCLPYFAQSVREEGSVNRAYTRGITILTAVGWTFLGFLAMAAQPAILLVYGDQWGAAVPLAQVLCMAAAVELVHYLAKEALLSHGEVRRASRLQLELQLVQLAGLLAGLPFGLIGACWGLLAGQLCGLWLSQRALHGITGLRSGAVLTACRPSLLLAGLALLPQCAIWLMFDPANARQELLSMLVGGVLTTLAWFGAMHRLQHPLWSEVSRLLGPALARLRRR
jgi:O-antigen/teichoic acid export membrane protein